MNPISVLVADGQRLAGEALVASLGDCPAIRPLPEVKLTAEDAVDSALDRRPDVVLLDLWIPGSLGAFAATRALRRVEPPPAVLLLSTVLGAPQADAALNAGASGFLPRSLSFPQVVEAVHRARDGEAPVFADELRRAVQEVEIREAQNARSARRLTTLSAREAEILAALAKGRSVDEVAAQLYLSRGTIRNHIQAVLRKTGTTNQREAIRFARQMRFLPAPYAKELGQHPGATPGLGDE